MHRSFTSITTSLRRTSAIAVAATILLSGGFAQADDDDHGHVHTAPHSHAAGYYGWSSHAATARSGLMHGYADILRSAGQRELLHYEAMRSREAAIEHELDNSVRRLEARQARQMMGLQRRETQRRMDRERRNTTSMETADAETVDEVADAERRAANKLHLARGLLNAGQTAAAERYFRTIIEDFAGTAAAQEAELLLARG